MSPQNVCERIRVEHVLFEKHLRAGVVSQPPHLQHDSNQMFGAHHADGRAVEILLFGGGQVLAFAFSR